MATVTPAEEKGPEQAWYALDAAQVISTLGVDAAQGLSTAEVANRAAQYGPNKFDEAKPEPRWRAFLRQYRDMMQVVLLVVGIGSIWPLHEYGTGIVVLLLTVFNALLGLQQEGKAAAAVAALQKMMFIKARVRRDGQLVELDAAELVPGDIVAIEAGDIVPADGRLLEAATLEVAESALTGESLPVSKSVDTIESADTPLGDRTDMLFMNTNVTRGTGLFVGHGDGDGDRGRSHLEHAPAPGRDGHSADPPAAEADDADPLHLGRRGRDLDHHQQLPRLRLQDGLHGGARVRDRGDPDGPAGGRHDDPLDGDAAAREGERDREAPALDGDARRDLGDQLRQDGNADAEPDDRRRARRSPAAATRSREPATRRRGRSSGRPARATCRSTSS